jgi:hypothetical protein
MNIKFRLPCPNCQAEMQAASKQPAAATIQGPLAKFCAHNNVGISVWVDRGVVIGWEVFSAGSPEQVKRRIQFQVQGAARLTDEIGGGTTAADENRQGLTG